MKYIVSVTKRDMKVTPYKGRHMSILNDIAAMIELAHNFGCISLDMCGFSIEIEDHENKAKMAPKDEIEVIIDDDRNQIIARQFSKTKSYKVKYIDGKEVIYNEDNDVIKEVLQARGYVYIENLTMNRMQAFKDIAYFYVFKNFTLIISKNINETNEGFISVDNMLFKNESGELVQVEQQQNGD